SPSGRFLVPDSKELRCVRYCVVYDCDTSSLDCVGDEEEETEKDLRLHSEPALANNFSTSSGAEEGTAIQYARSLQEFTLYPVLILRGGYRLFSARYHFLSTQKILWMPQELDNFQTYPVEILPAELYMGSFKQACDQQILKDLKIKAQVTLWEQPATPPAEGGTHLHITIPDSLEADLFSTFATISHFIDAQLHHGAVLVCSSLGISRSSTVTMAYLMHSCLFSLKRAWDHVLKCKPDARPHRGFVKQLSDWESRLYGIPITDISEPHY
ncbi:STYL1 protein, partial [Atlantisia rogersi]|nr:STYL1 protein [Atlantisia rogersi]